MRMSKRRLLGMVAIVLLGLGGTSVAEPPYTWIQVVERGMPDFNDPLVAQEASMATTPLRLSFPSGVHVVFVFVNHEGQTYGIYHDQQTKGVVGITRLDWDPFWPQGLRFYEFYVDTGLLQGQGFTRQFLYMAGSDRVFAGVCLIADMSKEARAHADCPRGV